MSEWKDVTIGDLCETISITYRRKDREVVLVNTSDVLEGKVLNHQLVPNENLKGQFKKTFQKNDILYSEIRPANKRFAFVDFDNTDCYIASTKLMVLRPKMELVDPRFLYAVLTSRTLINEMQHLAETRSGTFPQITFSSELAPYRVKLPDLETQKKIVSLLNAIEYKVETNNAINENLEQQISSIYANLCESKSWDSCELGNLIEVRDGTHDSPKPQTDGYLLVTSKHLFPYGVDRITPNRIAEKDFKKINERSLVEQGDVLMSMIGTIGLISFVADRTIDYVIKNVALFKTSKTPELVYYFLTFLKSKKTQQYIEMCLAGSTQKYISLGELRKMPIHYPDSETLEGFNEIVRPMYQTIILNAQENNAFAELRDSLLPKLISGELNISEIDI